MTKKKLEYWWENRNNLKGVMPTEVFRNYIRNRQMIDLNCTPKDIYNSAVSQYENYQYPHRSNILTYLVNHRMKMLIDSASEF